VNGYTLQRILSIVLNCIIDYFYQSVILEKTPLKSMENSLSLFYCLLGIRYREIRIWKSNDANFSIELTMVVITQKTQRSNSSTSTRLFWLREGQLHPNLLYNQLLRPRLTIPSISVFPRRFGTERYTELISSGIISFNCIIPANSYAEGSIRGTHATYQSQLRSISPTRNHYLVHVHVDDHILTIPANRQACKSQSHACNQRANSSLDQHMPQ
jgi:hypothetical protein